MKEVECGTSYDSAWVDCPGGDITPSHTTGKEREFKIIFWPLQPQSIPGSIV